VLGKSHETTPLMGILLLGDEKKEKVPGSLGWHGSG
jgi:hypothetical protein